MARTEIDVNPVYHITIDAIGKPGQRVFYIQGWQSDNQVITLILEKAQVQTLALGIEQFLAEVQQKYPDLPEATTEYDESKMKISPPVDPLYRVGELGLAYDADQDKLVLVAREILTEGIEPEESGSGSFLVFKVANACPGNMGIGCHPTWTSDLSSVRRTHGPGRSLLPEKEWA